MAGQMFGAIKKMFKRAGAASQDSSANQAVAEQESIAESPAVEAPTYSAGAAGAGDTLRVSLRGLVAQLPKELVGKSPAPASEALYLPKDQVLEQLPQGAIKVPFLQVRRVAPTGVVIAASTHDNRLVDVPLKEILAQLRPDSFQRRPDQRVIEVPVEIQDIFDSKGEPKAQMRVMQKDEIAKTPARSEPQTPAPEPTKMPVYQTPTASTFGAPPLPQQERIAISPSAVPLPTPPRAPAPTPMQPIQRGEFLIFNVSEISARWPDAIKRDIERLGVKNSKCLLPTSEIQGALKQGRVNYTWKQISSRLQPPLASGVQLSNEQTVVELPIAAVASAFFAQTQSTNPNRPVVRPPASVEPVFHGGPAAPPQQAPIAPPRPVAVPPQPAPPVPRSAPIQPSPQLRLQQEPASPAQPAAPIPAAGLAQLPRSTPAPAAPGGRPSKGNVTFKVSDVWAKWPEDLRNEAKKLNMAGLKVEIPFESVEVGLRTGKIDFSWREFCAWVENCPGEAQSSALAESRVDLPLAVLAPLCLRLSPPTQRKAESLEHIPDVFAAGGQTSAPQDDDDAPMFQKAPAMPAARPASTPPAAVSPPRPAPSPPAPQPAYTPPVAQTAQPRPAGPSGTDPGTAAKNLAELFGEPGKRNWTPNEIVQRTAQLPGVTGALIALQDGLLVANCMPPTWKTETIAAFLPQIFGRMYQYVKELSMGDLMSVTVSVEQGTLQVYKAGIIYFAALAKPDATLPLAALNLIARELSRHTK